MHCCLQKLSSSMGPFTWHGKKAWAPHCLRILKIQWQEPEIGLCISSIGFFPIRLHNFWLKGPTQFRGKMPWSTVDDYGALVKSRASVCRSLHDGISTENLYMYYTLFYVLKQKQQHGIAAIFLSNSSDNQHCWQSSRVQPMNSYVFGWHVGPTAVPISWSAV